MKNRISLKTGSEGPRHDPYSYEEVTVEGRNGKTTAHIGLGCWVRNNSGPKIHVEDVDLDKAFERYTGVSIAVATKLYHTLPYRKHARRCGCKETGSVSGYPGETLEVCLKCGEVVNGHFDRSAVE